MVASESESRQNNGKQIQPVVWQFEPVWRRQQGRWWCPKASVVHVSSVFIKFNLLETILLSINVKIVHKPFCQPYG